MENVFENAYFGKLYKTRDGRKSVFVKNYGIDNNKIIYENGTHYVGNNGRIYANVTDRNDIVSEWKESIDEEELDKLAENIVDTYLSCDYENGNISYSMLKNIFKVCYRKILEHE